MYMDYKKVWEMVTSERLKASQFAGDGGSISSKMLEVEKKSNIEFEHIHVRKTEGSENVENEGLKMVLKCDKVAKEERVKCVVENTMHDEETEGNTSLNLGNMKFEKSVVEVTKGIDSDRNSLEHVQHEHGENWELIDVEARNAFACCTPSTIKRVTGINMCGNRIKKIDKYNVTAACPMCFETENWERATKCSKNKDDRDEWMSMVSKQLKRAEEHKHAGSNEKEIVEEMLRCAIKCFNDDENYHTNQQMIGHKDMFRGVVVKEWIVGNECGVNFHNYNEILTKCCGQFHVECWKRRCVRLHSPEVQMKVLKEDAIALLDNARKDEVKGLKRHVEVNSMDVNEATNDQLVSWIKSVRIFKKRAKKNVHQDIRSVMNMRLR